MNGNDGSPTRTDWSGLAVLATGLGPIVLDGTVVGVALPPIIADLHLDITDAQWVNSLYAVLPAALLPSTGKLADAVGRRRRRIGPAPARPSPATAARSCRRRRRMLLSRVPRRHPRHHDGPASRRAPGRRRANK